MNTKLLYGFGRPFSPLYSLVMRLREYCYLRGILRRTTFDVPVLSIGNLTMGGTGKTPTVKYLASWLLDQGYHPAIISRGYGGATKEGVNVVSDGRTVFLEAEYVGDEPCMLAHALPGVMVLTGVVRKLPASRALEMGADVLLLDDGFQHMAIDRDLDLVLFNANTLAGNSRVFPGGDLREPVNALLRCHGFIMSGTDDTNRAGAERFAELLQAKFPGRPVFFTSSKVAGLLQRDPDGNETMVTASALSGHNSLAFCGIARPEGFLQTLDMMSVKPVGFIPLADHHQYKENVIHLLAIRAEKSGASCFVCTEKDLVKLRNFSLPLPLFAVIMKLETSNALTRFVGSYLFQDKHFSTENSLR